MNEIIVWNDVYKIKEDIIDSQHQMLINLINQLYTAVNSQKDSNIINLVNCLNDYATIHFTIEEQMMEKCCFPKAEAIKHKNAHDRFKKIVFEQQENLKLGKIIIVGEETLRFLREWLLNHISTMDMELGIFIAKKHD